MINPNNFFRRPQHIRYIIVHCSATPRNLDISVNEIRAYHKSLGFQDIGYHFVVDINGNIREGRPLCIQGAHCLGANDRSIGVCYIGGLEKDGRTPADTRTPEQKAALRRLIDDLRRAFPNAVVRGHRDFAKKACPCFDATAEYAGDDDADRMARFAALTAPIAATALLATSSCKSHKKSNFEEEYVYRYQGKLTEEQILEKLEFDSVEVRVDNPEIFEFKGDTVRRVFRAKEITVQKVDKARLKATESTQRTDSVDTVGSTSINTVSDVGPPGINPLSLIFYVACACAIALIARRLYKRKRQ